MLKLFLFAYLILFYGIAFFWRSYRIWRVTGINPYRLKNEEGMHGFLARMYRLVSVTVAVVILCFCGCFICVLNPDWLAGKCCCYGRCHCTAPGFLRLDTDCTEPDGAFLAHWY